MTLHLMRPEWLWALLPCAFVTIALWRNQRHSGSWGDIIAPELLPFLVAEKEQSRRPVWPVVAVAWVLAVFAATGPSWNKIPQPVHQKQDALVLIMDLSYSMRAGDISPSRVDRARQKLLDLLQARREGQTGLIAYAGDAHVVTPLTDDNPTIANLLPALNPDMMPVPGSDAAAAVAKGLELLRSAGVTQGRLLLVTDGVSPSHQKVITTLLSETGITLSVLGVGTTSGAPIPMPNGGFLKDRDGSIVLPALDEAALRQLASAASGRYQSLQIDSSDLDTLLAQSELPANTPTLALDRSADAWEDRGYLLVLCLLPVALGLFRRGWLLSLLPLLFISAPQPAHAGLWEDLWLTRDQQAQRALQEGDSKAAAELFESPAWAGTAAYASGDYETAVERFSDQDNADSWYNRGNALARTGQLDEALEAYRQSLALQPDSADALQNIELLEQLKEQQQKQQQQQQQQQENGEQENDGESPPEGSPDSGDKQSGDQEQQPQEGEQGASDEKTSQQPPSSESRQQSQNPSPHNEKPSASDEQQSARPSTGEGTESSREQTAQQAEAEPLTPEEQEREQAMQQWLRRVPDDPSGLLREKFRYESQQREQRGNRSNDETIW